MSKVSEKYFVRPAALADRRTGKTLSGYMVYKLHYDGKEYQVSGLLLEKDAKARCRTLNKRLQQRLEQESSLQN